MTKNEGLFESKITWVHILEVDYYLEVGHRR